MFSVQPDTGVLVLGTPQAKAETATPNGKMSLDVLKTLLGVLKKERMPRRKICLAPCFGSTVPLVREMPTKWLKRIYQASYYDPPVIY
ncbi:hypothetical protein D350_02894 [Enterococcus faecalis VC1B-1]|nr:hypothetical protein D350_02894 [Enterococcus faecalis VC1B-1]